MQKNILDVIMQGDSVSHAIAILLLILSIATWVVFLYKYLVLHYLNKKIPLTINNFWKAESFLSGVSEIQNQEENCVFLVTAVINAQNAAGQQINLAAKDRLAKNLRASLQHLHNKIHTGHNFLATVGSTSPFVGLFGTVWGIYHALNSISNQGQVSIDKIAGPVGEALIMTAFGLLVALPAVVAYNILSKKAKIVYQNLDGFAKDLHNIN